MAINQGVNRSEFTYDGWGKRVRMVEKVSGATTSDRRFVWCGMEICEERGSDGTTVVKRFFSQGVQESGTALYYATDHLGSVRELTDTAGAVRARYDYDPYGRTTKLSGDKNSDYTYAGLFAHSASGLHLAVFRAYDSGLGRWVNHDPAGLAGGVNLYAYVNGDPDGVTDSLGLQADVNYHKPGGVEQGTRKDGAKSGYFDPHAAGNKMPHEPGIWKETGHSQTDSTTKQQVDLAFDRRGEKPNDPPFQKTMDPKQQAENTRTEMKRRKIDPRTIKEIQLYFCNMAEGSDPYAQRYADEICKPVRPCVTNPKSNDIQAPFVSCDLAPTPFMPRPGKCGN